MTGHGKPKLVLVNVATFAAVCGLCVTVFFWRELHDLGKEPPVDPLVTEQLSQARGLQKVGKWADAAEIIERYAHQGYPRALFHHAKILSRGWGVKPDMEKASPGPAASRAVQFFLRGEAAYELGQLYREVRRPGLQPDRHGVVPESAGLGLPEGSRAACHAFHAWKLICTVTGAEFIIMKALRKRALKPFRSDTPASC